MATFGGTYWERLSRAGRAGSIYLQFVIYVICYGNPTFLNFRNCILDLAEIRVRVVVTARWQQMHHVSILPVCCRYTTSEIAVDILRKLLQHHSSSDTAKSLYTPPCNQITTKASSRYRPLLRPIKDFWGMLIMVIRIQLWLELCLTSSVSLSW